MRISDWSSDVCSSDLGSLAFLARQEARLWPSSAVLRPCGCGTVLRPPDRPPVEAASGGIASLEGGYHGTDWQLHPRRKRRLHRRNPHPDASRQGEYPPLRSEENTSELQSLMRISYAVFCLKQKKQNR